jgi:hypothetical protein
MMGPWNPNFYFAPGRLPGAQVSLVLRDLGVATSVVSATHSVLLVVSLSAHALGMWRSAQVSQLRRDLGHPIWLLVLESRRTGCPRFSVPTGGRSVCPLAPVLLRAEPSEWDERRCIAHELIA